MKEINLSQNEIAQVSDEDYEYLMQWDWKKNSSGSRNVHYAVRYEWKDDGTGRKKNYCIMMHRVIAERAGLDLSKLIDHIDRNGLNNQRDNLRSATNKENQENTGLPSNNTSGCKGVSWDKRSSKWRATIYHHKKRIYLGYFKNKEEAIKVRKQAETEYFTHAI